MKSKKAKEFLKEVRVPKLYDHDNKKFELWVHYLSATKAVELAEQEMIEKAVETFNMAHCEAYCDYGTNSEVCQNCRKLKSFINQLDNE